MGEAQTRRYPGVTEAERLAAFTTDAGGAAAAGWFPVSQAVESDASGNPVLAVTYGRRAPAPGAGVSPTPVDFAPPPPPPAGSAPPPAPSPTSGGTAQAPQEPRPSRAGARLVRWLAIAGVVLLLGGAVIAGSSTGPLHGFFSMIGTSGLGLLFAAAGLFAWHRSTWGRGLRITLALIAGLFVVSAIGSAFGQLSGTETSTISLAITSHQSGETMTASEVTVSGTTGPGARVVRDIPSAPDDATTADASGTWSMPVTLATGVNELVFRVDDDKSSTVKLLLTLLPSASASPDQPTEMPPVPTPTPVPDAIKADDPTGDQVDENDKPAKGPAYQDITRVAVEARQGRIQLDTWVAATPPTVDPVKEIMTFNWYLDTNGDGTPEWQVLVGNTDVDSEMNAPGWDAGVTDLRTGQTRMASEFPGTLVVDGNHVTARVLLFAIEFPTQIAVAAATESDVYTDPVNDPTNDTLRHDYVPDSQWPNGSDWLRVAVSQ